MPSCPICGATYSDADLQDHVNACLDSAEGGDQGFQQPPPQHHVPPPVYGVAGSGANDGSGKRPRDHEVIHIDDDQPSQKEELVPCPICSNTFPTSQIQEHASRCDGTNRSEPTFACQLCRKDNVGLSQCFRMDECGHPFCRDCVTKYANETIFVAVTLLCPFKGCKAAFSIRDTEMLLPELSKQKSNADRARVAPKGKLNPTKRLMEEFRYLKEGGGKNGFSVETVDDDLFKWNAFFFNFDPKDEPIAKDLQKTGNGKLTFLIEFPKDYPLGPPAVRLLRPRLQHMTGHVTIGGSVCFEMLTSQGWQPQFTVESLLVSIRANLIAGGARVDHKNKSDYTAAEAKDAFDRMLRVHGWTNN